MARQMTEQQHYLFFDLSERQLGWSIVRIVDVPVFHPIHPGREPCLEKGPVLCLFEGDHVVCGPKVEVQYLQRESSGHVIENAPGLEAGERMGRDRTGIVQAQLGGDSTGGCPPAEVGLAGPCIKEDFGEPAAVVVAGA